jgi:predicted small lipoprotein YifL
MTARNVAGLALLVALCGCGQVGPLYLPEEQATTTTVVPATVPATPATGNAAAPAPDTNAAPAAGAATTDAAGTDVPDRTDEPRRRAH